MLRRLPVLTRRVGRLRSLSWTLREIPLVQMGPSSQRDWERTRTDLTARNGGFSDDRSPGRLLRPVGIRFIGIV